MTATMTIVWDKTASLEPVTGRPASIGTTSHNFMALWAEEDGSLHYTVAVTPELQHVADAIEELLRKEEYGPVLDVLKLPEMPEPDWDES